MTKTTTPGDATADATHTHTIPQKMSGTGTIHDIASDMYDRDIVFAHGCKWAVVLAAYYGGKGCTTHRTMAATIAAARCAGDYSFRVIGRGGEEYAINYNDMERV